MNDDFVGALAWSPHGGWAISSINRYNESITHRVEALPLLVTYDQQKRMNLIFSPLGIFFCIFLCFLSLGQFQGLIVFENRHNCESINQKIFLETWAIRYVPKNPFQCSKKDSMVAHGTNWCMSGLFLCSALVLWLDSSWTTSRGNAALLTPFNDGKVTLG